VEGKQDRETDGDNEKDGGEVALERQIGVRLAPKDCERLERLAVHLSVRALARAAPIVGLDIIEAQPGVLTGEKQREGGASDHFSRLLEARAQMNRTGASCV
jgi:hypothetical protein